MVNVGPLKPIEGPEWDALVRRWNAAARAPAGPMIVLPSSTGIPQELTAGMGAFTGGCGHPDAVPVETLLGERVAALCPDCDAQLPAGWATAEPGDREWWTTD